MSIAVAEEKKTKLNQLDQLKRFTKVVADTADFESIREYKPQDATTNPSLVYAATQKQQYAHLLDEVLTDRKKSGLTGAAQIEDIIDHLLVTAQGRFLPIGQHLVEETRVLFLLRCGINQTRIRRRVLRLKIFDRFKIGRVGDNLGELLQLIELVQLRFLLFSDSSAHNFPLYSRFSVNLPRKIDNRKWSPKFRRKQ